MQTKLLLLPALAAICHGAALPQILITSIGTAPSALPTVFTITIPCATVTKGCHSRTLTLYGRDAEDLPTFSIPDISFPSRSLNWNGGSTQTATILPREPQVLDTDSVSRTVNVSPTPPPVVTPKTTLSTKTINSSHTSVVTTPVATPSTTNVLTTVTEVSTGATLPVLTVPSNTVEPGSPSTTLTVPLEERQISLTLWPITRTVDVSPTIISIPTPTKPTTTKKPTPTPSTKKQTPTPTPTTKKHLPRVVPISLSLSASRTDDILPTVTLASTAGFPITTTLSSKSTVTIPPPTTTFVTSKPITTPLSTPVSTSCVAATQTVTATVSITVTVVPDPVTVSNVFTVTATLPALTLNLKEKRQILGLPTRSFTFDGTLPTVTPVATPTTKKV